METPTRGTNRREAATNPLDHPTRLEFWVSTANRDGEGWIVTVIGDLDAATAPKLRAEITPVIEDRTGDIELDLRGCGFVDSSGIAALVWTAMRLAERERRLILLGARERVRGILELSGVAGHGAVLLEPPPAPGE